jgi:hypothetical protein
MNNEQDDFSREKRISAKKCVLKCALATKLVGNGSTINETVPHGLICGAHKAHGVSPEQFTSNLCSSNTTRSTRVKRVTRAHATHTASHT